MFTAFAPLSGEVPGMSPCAYLKEMGESVGSKSFSTLLCAFIMHARAPNTEEGIFLGAPATIGALRLRMVDSALRPNTKRRLSVDVDIAARTAGLARGSRETGIEWAEHSHSAVPLERVPIQSWPVVEMLGADASEVPPIESVLSCLLATVQRCPLCWLDVAHHGWCGEGAI